MDVTAQPNFLVVELPSEGGIALAVRLADLALKLLETLAAPAVCQFVEGFQKTEPSGYKIPF